LDDPLPEDQAKFFNQYVTDHIDENGQFKGGSAAITRMHEMELLRHRIYWSGNLRKDFTIFVKNGHPLIGIFSCDPLHPFSRKERIGCEFCLWSWAFLFSVVAAVGNPEATATEAYTSSILLITLPCLVLDIFMKQLATCSCIKSAPKSIREPLGKLGEMFLALIVVAGFLMLLCGLAMLGASPVGSTFLVGFCVGRLQGYAVWFFPQVRNCH